MFCQAFGAEGEIRTHTLLAIVSKTIVATITPPPQILVQPTGIEPVSTVLQTAAMTTSARVAWCFVKESNFRIPLVRRAVYHLPNEARC